MLGEFNIIIIRYIKKKHSLLLVYNVVYCESLQMFEYTVQHKMLVW